MSKYYIGVEIGGTKQQICVGHGDGTILHRKSVQLGSVTAKEILEWIEANVRSMMEDYEIEGIGVGFGGPLETETGMVLTSLQVDGWESFRLKDHMKECFGVDVTVANDTYVGGIGELMIGAGRDAEILLYTNIGTGIGGGLFYKGKGYDGSGYGAAYVGNTIVPDWTQGVAGSGAGVPDVVDSCASVTDIANLDAGAQGIVGSGADVTGAAYTRTELICSGKSINERLRIPGYVPTDSYIYDRAGGDVGKMDTVLLAEGARAGDSFACEELDRVAETFAIALANVLAITGATRIVIGGGVAKMGDILIDRIRERLEVIAFAANKGRYDVCVSKLLDDAVLAGALILAAGGIEML